MRTNRWILAACAALPFAVAATAAADDANRATTLGYRGVIVGGSVHQTEPVSGDLSAAGGQLTIDAPVARNLRAAGGHVEIGSNAAIGGNVSVAGGKVEIHAPVKGDVRVAGGQVLIDSSIDGNVERITLASACECLRGRARTVLRGCRSKPGSHAVLVVARASVGWH